MLASGYTLSETSALPLGEAVERVRAIAAIDASRTLSIVDNDALIPIAADVSRRLASVVRRTVSHS